MSQLLHARYQVVNVLGADAVEETFLSIDKESASQQKLCIVKKIGNISDREHISKVLIFLRQQKNLINKIRENNQDVQEIYDFFVEDQQLFVVQEYIPGVNLSQEIAATSMINESQIIELMFEILKPLSKLHQQSLFHGNLKPNNIIRRELDNQLVFVDFGTIHHGFVHRDKDVEYMPIEQFHGNPHPGTDIYAVGVMMISALTGLSAIQIAGENSHHNLFTGEISWRRYNPEVSRQLVKIINKMVRLDYRQRYQMIATVISDLEKFIHPPKRKKLIPENFQNWKLFVVAAIAGCLLTGATIYFSFPPNDIHKAQTLLEQGLTRYQQANYPAAISKLNQAIKSNPNLSTAYNIRADAYYRLGDYQKSQADASEAIRLNPEDANALYDRGFSLYKLKNFNGAIADFDQAIAMEANNANNYYGRGLARMQIRETEAAIADFTKAISLNYQFEAAYIERGQLYRIKGLTTEALNDFNQVISLNPENIDAYYQRGLTQYQRSELQTAKNDLTKVIELEPDLIKAYILRGSVYNDLRDYEKAMDDFNIALKIDPKSSDVYTQRGNFYLQKGNLDQAIADLNRAISLNSKDEKAYNFRGNVKQEQGLFPAALQDYNQAIAINSEYANAYYNRGLVNMTLGNIPKAIADFEKAAQLFQNQRKQQSYNDAIAKLKSLKPNYSPEVNG